MNVRVGPAPPARLRGCPATGGSHIHLSRLRNLAHNQSVAQTDLELEQGFDRSLGATETQDISSGCRVAADGRQVLLTFRWSNGAHLRWIIHTKYSVILNSVLIRNCIVLATLQSPKPK
ncbi:uncharacterized [Tachysurus ichikawai]